VDLRTAYLQIIERSLIAAEKSLTSHMNELSLGGALVSSAGKPNPENSNRRLSAFHKEVRRQGLEPRYLSRVSKLAIIIASLRNEILHPTVHPDGAVTAPNDVLSKAELEDFIRQLKEVKAIVNTMI
jgi:hypothetical protein